MNIDNSTLANILKRKQSLFEYDFSRHKNELIERLKGTRILIIGAAGSVGFAVVKQISLLNGLSCLHLIDINENNLVEVVRDLRSSNVKLPTDFKSLPIALGSLEFDMFLQSERDYDFVLNFAALKHVRSEKDPYSLIRMYNANVFYVKELLDRLKNSSLKKMFSVSTDKAVKPYSIMGATKMFMERLLLAYSKKIISSTARFANVAFSDGSLLYSFINRFNKKQPISAPIDIKRYFISHDEAGQLCLLSCFLGANRDIYFPKMDQNIDFFSFSDLAKLFLKSKGYEAEIFYSEDEAKEAVSKLNSSSTKWPCYFFESDTTGEKAYEEFYTSTDSVDFNRYYQIGIINQSDGDDSENVFKAIDAFEKLKKSGAWQKEDIVENLKIVVPELNHEEKYRNLDQKM